MYLAPFWHTTVVGDGLCLCTRQLLAIAHGSLLFGQFDKAKASRATTVIVSKSDEWAGRWAGAGPEFVTIRRETAEKWRQLGDCDGGVHLLSIAALPSPTLKKGCYRFIFTRVAGLNLNTAASVSQTSTYRNRVIETCYRQPEEDRSTE